MELILVKAREMDNRFEWVAHEPEALQDGLSQATIDAAKHRRGVEELPETEAVTIQLGRQISAKKIGHSDIFERALKIFEPKHMVELVTLRGFYLSTAALITAFDLQVAPGQKPLLPLP